MGVYIPNMEIPKSCGKCPFNVNSLKCSRTSSEIDRDFEFQARNSDCPLLAVPVPHGRLIDTDLLLKFEHSICFGEDNEEPLNVIFADIVRRFLPTIEREDE